MSKFQVEFYENVNGERPVEDFIKSLDKKMRAKVLGMINILQEYGNELREPYSKHLDAGIFELRVKVGSDISRVLYFFYFNRKIVLPNGFVKKMNKTPRVELQRAKQYRENYLKRYSKYEQI